MTNETSNLLVRTYIAASTSPIRKYPNTKGKSKCMIEKNTELINIHPILLNLRFNIFILRVTKYKFLN